MAKFHAGIEQAKRYVRFCISLYKHQLDNGCYFLHEHPWLATSWLMPEMQHLVNIKANTELRDLDYATATEDEVSSYGVLDMKSAS